MLFTWWACGHPKNCSDGYLRQRYGSAHLAASLSTAPPPPPNNTGLFTLALVAAAEDRHLSSALFFSLLLCLKHIFLYAAPAFFVFLLRRYCRGPRAVPRFFGLGAVVGATFAAAFGPFVAAGQLPQVGGLGRAGGRWGAMWGII